MYLVLQHNADFDSVKVFETELEAFQEFLYLSLEAVSFETSRRTVGDFNYDMQEQRKKLKDTGKGEYVIETNFCNEVIQVIKAKYGKSYII